VPAIDVVHEDGKLIVRADAPGIKPEDVKIEVQDDILTSSGEHEQHTEEQHKHYVRHERRCGSFSRSTALPAGADRSRSRRRPAERSLLSAAGSVTSRSAAVTGLSGGTSLPNRPLARRQRPEQRDLTARLSAAPSGPGPQPEALTP
jgi:Hsp20/alpha crystallin family